MPISPLGPWVPILPQGCLAMQGWLRYSLPFILACRLFIISQNLVANELFLHFLLFLACGKQKKKISKVMNIRSIIISGPMCSNKEVSRSEWAYLIIWDTTVAPVRTINIRHTCPPTDPLLCLGRVTGSSVEVDRKKMWYNMHTCTRFDRPHRWCYWWVTQKGHAESHILWLTWGHWVSALKKKSPWNLNEPFSFFLLDIGVL